jgi:hypothetical protein
LSYIYVVSKSNCFLGVVYYITGGVAELDPVLSGEKSTGI